MEWSLMLLATEENKQQELKPAIRSSWHVFNFLICPD